MWLPIANQEAPIWFLIAALVGLNPSLLSVNNFHSNIQTYLQYQSIEGGGVINLLTCIHNRYNKFVHCSYRKAFFV